MKKLFLLFIPAIILVSCSKSSSTSNNNNNNNNNTSQGTLTATIDGTDMNFNVYQSAGHVNTTGSYSIFVAGYAGPITSSNYLEVSVIAEPSPIGTGTYYDDISVPKINVAIDYVTVPGDVAYISNGISPDTAVVIITSIDANSLIGTFSGGVVSISSGSHTITNGKFNLKFSS
jgi:hypothetical protein